MPNLISRLARYARCYRELTFGERPDSVEQAIDRSLDWPILIDQVRSEIVQLGKILQDLAPKCSLEIGTNFGGTLYLLCALSPPGARIISVDFPGAGIQGQGYRRRRVPLYRRFARDGQRLHLLRADSHSPETKNRVMRILNGEPLDYLFIDADHSYRGVESDFQMYSPLVRSGGVVAFHDIFNYHPNPNCEVAKFWEEIRQRYRHQEFVEGMTAGNWPVAISGPPMPSSGLGVLYMP